MMPTNGPRQDGAPSPPKGFSCLAWAWAVACRLGEQIRRLGPSIFPRETAEERAPRKDHPSIEQTVYFGRWFVRMRWIAWVVAALLTVLSTKVFGYLVDECFWPLLILVACLAATNVLFDLLLRRRWLIHRLLELQILVDLLILTAMLHFSGGGENPASFAYVFHIIISGILLNPRKCYLTVLVATLLFAGMAFAEMTHTIEHYTLSVFPHVMRASGLAHGAHEPAFVSSMVSFQFVLMFLTAYFTTSIMERLRVQEHRALTERQRLQHVVQATGAGLAVLDKDLQPVWLNEQIRNWLCLPDEAAGRSSQRLEDWIGGPGGPVAQTFRDARVRVVERSTSDPERKYFHVTVAPLKDRDGGVYQVVELAQDITERKLIEAEMLHSAKMAVLGFMAAGIAHEVGNPLASIATRLRLLEEEHDEAFLKESLPLLMDQTGRIARIVHGVSQFARPAGDEWADCRINDVVKDTIEILRFHKQAASCRIVTHLAEDLPTTTGVKDQLAQVFLNLGLNALQAMPEGGTLAIRTFPGEDVINITFADNGKGMGEGTRAKVFDPFFSTKQEGLGLGLCIVRQLIDAHGGRVDVDSEPGSGTVFTVTLPVGISMSAAGPKDQGLPE